MQQNPPIRVRWVFGLFLGPLDRERGYFCLGILCTILTPIGGDLLGRYSFLLWEEGGGGDWGTGGGQ